MVSNNKSKQRGKTVKIQMSVKVELRDKNGKITKTIEKPCHSYVRQLIDLLDIFFKNDVGQVIKDTSGTNRNLSTISWGFEGFKTDAGATVDDFGILVGTSPSPITISDFKLWELILHGDSANKLNYGATSVGVVAIVGSTAKFTIARTLTNNSGADITTEEVCLVVDTSGNHYWIMLERTLLSFTVANGTSGTVTYTISVTV